MTQDELKLVLEALITITDAIYVNNQQEADAVYKANDAVKAIKEALAQPEQEPVAWVSEDVCEGQYINGRPRKIWWECEKGVGTAFYTTPPQRTKQELIAYLYNMGYKAGHHDTLEGTYIDIFRQDMSTYHSDVVSEWLEDEGYTTPPQRTWVGLTEQERNDIEDYCEMMIGKPAFDAIEAKLKEKNT